MKRFSFLLLLVWGAWLLALGSNGVAKTETGDEGLRFIRACVSVNEISGSVSIYSTGEDIVRATKRAGQFIVLQSI